MELFKEWLETLKKDPTAYTFLCGDTFEFARTTYRAYLKAYPGDTTSSKELDRLHLRDISDLAQRLKPVAHKILGVIRGNHMHVLESKGGVNSEQVLCEMLGVRYLGVAGVVRIDLRQSKNRDRIRDSLVVWLHHDGGSRGGRSKGHNVNVLFDQANKVEADIYCIAHTHDTYGRVEPRRFVSRSGQPVVYEQDRAFIRAGCFRKVVTRPPNRSQPDDHDYADDVAYEPKHSGWVELQVHYPGTLLKGNRRMKVFF
jgi:hypothetical protein